MHTMLSSTWPLTLIKFTSREYLYLSGKTHSWQPPHPPPVSLMPPHSVIPQPQLLLRAVPVGDKARPAFMNSLWGPSL